MAQINCWSSYLMDVRGVNGTNKLSLCLYLMGCLYRIYVRGVNEAHKLLVLYLMDVRGINETNKLLVFIHDGCRGCRWNKMLVIIPDGYKRCQWDKLLCS